MARSSLKNVAADSGVHLHYAKPWTRRVALFGDDAPGTRRAVETFIESKLLDSFLASLWKGC